MRRLVLLVLLAGLVLAGCGGTSGPRRAPVRRAAQASTTAMPHVLQTGAQAAAPTRPALPDPRTVRRALRRALLTGHLSARDHAADRRAYRDARRAIAHLRGPRRAELAGVLEQLRDMARRRALTAGRLPQAFLVLRRNTWFWTHAALPAPRMRRTFGRDPLIFQYYPGHGLQLQPLASFGKANALARVCLVAARDRHGARCRPHALRRLLDRLVAMAAPRGGIPAWESWFAFADAAPGWVSGMTQGTAIEALTRGAHALHRPAYLRLARRAVRLFARPAPLGVAVAAPGGTQYLMYSTLPGMRVLNGHLQAVTGLRDLAVATGDAVALRAYRSGERAARAALRADDTGAWSLYNAGGPEASLSYHRLTQGFLENLCRRTRHAVYCDGARRFARYLREPPRVGLDVPHRLRLGRSLRVAFTLSKISDVTVSVRDRRGIELRRRFRVARGSHALSLRPRRAGRVRVTVAAVGLSGPRARRSATLRVRRPPRPHRRKKAHRRQARRHYGETRAQAAPRRR